MRDSMWRPPLLLSEIQVDPSVEEKGSGNDADEQAQNQATESDKQRCFGRVDRQSGGGAEQKACDRRSHEDDLRETRFP